MRLISEQKRSQLNEAFVGGKGIRAAARSAGVAKQTAARYFRELGANPNCGCGLPSTHKGWCAVRFKESPKRQRFMQAWHGKEMSVEIDELCEWCFEAGRERGAITLIAGVPLCSSCSVSTKQERFPERKQALYEPDAAATSPIRTIAVPPQRLKQMVEDVRDDLGDLVKQVHEEIEAAKKEPMEPEAKSGFVVFDPTSGEIKSCECGKPLKHRGRCIGQKASMPAAGAAPKKAIPLKREKTITPERVEAVFPEADVVIADSVWRVPLESGGELSLLFNGDVFNMLRNKEDMCLMSALVNTIKCRGRMMYPFTELLKDKKTGETVKVQSEPGFIADMIDCLDLEDKLKLLTMAWAK